ncbi:hypothetical protein JCM19233_2602 [Vibrio astriarenae]|nr:hypothetical protein JCM19233_2602 [Vibrio sp. C7]
MQKLSSKLKLSLSVVMIGEFDDQCNDPVEIGQPKPLKHTPQQAFSS